MKHIFYLSTCDTCKRILNELGPLTDFTLQDIKTSPMTSEQLDKLHAKVSSYESLFSKRARLYKERKLNTKALSEKDYKQLLLEHYTFLKRPVIVFHEQVFVGNSKKVVAAAIEALHS